MFKCDSCAQLSAPLFRLSKTVRPVDYTHVFKQKTNKKKGPVIQSSGWETVEESHLCRDCYEHLKNQIPQKQSQRKQVRWVQAPYTGKGNSN